MTRPTFDEIADTTAGYEWMNGAFNYSLDNNSSNVPEKPLNHSVTYSFFRQVTDYYSSIHGYAASIVCMGGIPANMAIIVVLTRPKMAQSSTNQLLIWLAVSDLMTMASFLPIAINFYVLRNPEWLFPSTKSKAWICYLIFAINSVVTWHTIAIWLTITLAIFRYLFICYPTRGQELCNKARAKMAIALVFCCCILFCIPNYFLTEICEIPLQSPGSDHDYNYYINDTTAVFNFTEIASQPDAVTTTKPRQIGIQDATTIGGYDRQLQQREYYYSVRDAESFALLSHINFWIQALLFKLTPCLLLTALTCFLVSAMREARLRRSKLKSQGRRDESDRAAEHQRTTAMLLAIVGLFLVTEFPQGLLTLLSIFIADFHHDYYQPLGDILDIAALLNNSINFLLYCVMSRQFRETFAEVFLRSSKCGFCISVKNPPVVGEGSTTITSNNCITCARFTDGTLKKNKGNVGGAKNVDEDDKMLRLADRQDSNT